MVCISVACNNRNKEIKLYILLTSHQMFNIKKVSTGCLSTQLYRFQLVQLVLIVQPAAVLF